MRRLMISLLATAALVLCGPAFSVAQASPLASSIGIPSQHYSPIENIGCRHAGDTCPYGKRIVRHSGRGTTCEPCESKEDDSSEKKGKSSSQKKSLVTEDIQAAHHLTTKAAAIMTDRTKATLTATAAMTAGVKATTAMKATTAGMKATLMATKGATEAMTTGMKAPLEVTMAMTGKAMAAAVEDTTVGTKAIAIGGMDLHVNGTTAKDPLQVGGLTTSVPMDGKSATACNLAKSGTAASKRQFHG